MAREAVESPESHDSTVVVSLLDRLKSPDASLLARKRKVLTKPPPVGKKRYTGVRSCNDPGVHPSKCVTEYPGEHLKVSSLFCEASREILSVLSSTLANMKSAKHLDGKKGLKGGRHNVFREKVVEAFLRAGICFSKLEFF